MWSSNKKSLGMVATDKVYAVSYNLISIFGHLIKREHQDEERM